MPTLQRIAAVCAVVGVLPAQEAVNILLGTHDRVQLSADAERIAVGNEDVVSAELIDTREVLLLGKTAGSTTLLAWLEGGEVQQFDLRVSRDITLLREALQDLYPTITAEIAPDREAVVLRGEVPNADVRAEIMGVARGFLAAGRSTVQSFDYELDAEGRPARIRLTDEGSDPDWQVIDLMTPASPAPNLEERIGDALRAVAGDGIRVRRVRRSAARNDEEDILVLEGTVQTQVALSRALQLASKLFLGRTTSESEIEVLADESGGLVRERFDNSTQNSGGSGGFAGGLGGGGSGLSVGRNDIERNIGRATILSVAGGRVLSFLDLADKPQVRVGVQLYEVDRNALLSFTSEIQLLVSDFDQPNLGPALAGNAIQPNPALPGTFTDTDVQAGLQSLANGFGQQLQIAGSRAALDTLFQVLEAKGIARRLSNPVLTVLSGETARFQVGGEIPVPQAFTPASGAAAGQGTFNTIEFRTFGIGLSVRPLVGEIGDLTLDLGSLISQPDEVLTTLVRESTGVSPQTTAFATRSLETNARLRDGQSLLVGGLVSEATRSDITKVPILGDIPLLGWLFRSENDSDDSTELFIVVSPTIVRDPIPRAQLWEQPGIATILESCRSAVVPPGDDEDSETTAKT